jgi:hypothetical protein
MKGIEIMSASIFFNFVSIINDIHESISENTVIAKKVVLCIKMTIILCIFYLAPLQCDAMSLQPVGANIRSVHEILSCLA